MRLNTHMMLIAGYVSIVTAMPAGGSSGVLMCGGYPCAGFGSLCINNACSKTCITNDDCGRGGLADGGGGCADVHTPNYIQGLGKYCVSEDICEKDYQSGNYWINAKHCKMYCGKYEEGCTPGSFTPLTQIYNWRAHERGH